MAVEAPGIGASGYDPDAVPARKSPNTHPKRAAATKALAPTQQTAKASERNKSRKGLQDRKAHGTESDAVSEAVGDTVAEASAEAMQPADAAQPAKISLAASQAADSKAAAQWDQATDMVRFDWAEIERTASRQGPNQGMAKLLIAACAEGANSRWPL